MDRLLGLKYRPIDLHHKLRHALEERRYSTEDLIALHFELLDLEVLAKAKNASVGSTLTWDNYIRLRCSRMFVWLAILAEGGKKLVSMSDAAPILFELRGVKLGSEEEDKAIQDFVLNFN